MLALVLELSDALLESDPCMVALPHGEDDTLGECELEEHAVADTEGVCDSDADEL